MHETPDGKSPRSGRWAVLALLALLVALPACRSGADDWLETYPQVAQRAREDPAAFTVAALRQWEAVDALTASYGLRVSRGVGSRSFDVSVVVERPDHLEISFLDPTGATEAFLIHGPGEIGLYFARDRVLYRAASRPGAFERALGLEIGPAEVVAAIVGYALVGGAGDGETPASTWDADARRIRVRSDRALGWLHPVSLLWDRVESFAVHDPGAGLATAAELEPDGRAVAEPVIVATFDSWKLMAAPTDAFDEATRLVDPPGGARPGQENTPATVPIPAEIDLDVVDGSYGVSLQLHRDPRLNPEVPADYFQVPPLPGGTLTLPLADLEREGGLFRRAKEEVEEQGDSSS